MAIPGVEKSPYAPLLLDEVGANKTITPSSIEGKGIIADDWKSMDMGSDREVIIRSLENEKLFEDYKALKAENEARRKESSGTPLVGRASEQRDYLRKEGRLPESTVLEAFNRGFQSSFDNMGMALLVASRSVDKSEVIEITKSQIEKRSKQKQLYGEGWDKLLSPEMWAESISSQVIPTTASLVTGRVNPKAGIAIGTTLYALQGYGGSFIDTFAQAKAENKTDEEAYDMAVNVGFSGGALEAIDGALPIVGKLGRKFIAGLYKGAGKPVSRAIKLWDKSTDTAKKRLLLSGGGDAITEMASGFLVDVAKDVEGITIDYNIEKYLQEGVVGAGTGTLIGGAQELMFNGEPSPTNTQEEAPSEPTTPVEPVSEQATVEPEVVTEPPPAKGEIQPDKPVQLYDVNANFKKNPADYVIYTEEELGDKEKAYIASNTEGRVQFAVIGESTPQKQGQQSLLLKYDPNSKEWAYEDLGQAPDVNSVTTEPVAETTPTQEVAPVEAPIAQAPVADEVAQEPVSEAMTADVIQPAVEPVQETVQPTPEVSTQQDNFPLNVTGSDGTIVGTDANILSEVGEADGKKYVKVEYTDPTDGKKKQSIVPQDYVRPSELNTQPAPVKSVGDTIAPSKQPLKPTETALETPAPVEPAKQAVQEAKPTPAQESDVIPDDEDSVSKKIGVSKEAISEIRNFMGLPPQEKGLKKSDVETFSNAKNKGYNTSAPAIAKDVINGKKTLDDEETAGITMAYGEAVVAYKKAKANRNKAEKDGDTEAYQRYLDQTSALQDQIIEYQSAIRASGTQTGRNLRSLRFAYNEDTMSAEFLINKVNKRRKGRKPKDAKEEAKRKKEIEDIKDISDKDETYEAKIKELEEQIREITAKEENSKANKGLEEAKQDAIKIRKRVKVKALESRNDEIKKRLIEMGYRANDITSSISGGIEATKLISELISNNIRIAVANSEIVTMDRIVSKVQSFFEDVKDNMPSKGDILKVLGMKEASRKVKTVENAGIAKRKLQKQARLEIELDNAMEGIFKKRERIKNEKLSESEKSAIDREIDALNIKISDLRVEYYNNIKEADRLIDFEEKINKVQEMLDKDITKFPKTKEGKEESQAIKDAKSRLKDLMDIMYARQSTKELQDEIDNFNKNPLPKETRNESEQLKNARKVRDLKRRELQVMRSLENSFNTLENDLKTGMTTKASKNPKVTSDAIENMRVKVEELTKIREERDKAMAEPQKKIEREQRQNKRRLRIAEEKLELLKEVIATGNKVNRKAGTRIETEAEKEVKEEYRALMKQINKQERIKVLLDKIAYAEEVGLPKGRERRQEDPEIVKLKKEYSSLLSSLRKEEKAMTEPSPEEKYNESQDAKLERYEEKITDFLSGVLDEKRNKIEDREDVKEVKEELNNLKKNKRLDEEISNIEKEITDFNRDLEDSKKSNKEKPDIIKEKEEILKSKRKELSIMKRLRDSINRITSGVTVDSRDNPKVESDIISSMREDLRILILTQKINNVKSGKVKTSTPKERESDEIESLKEELSQETKLLNYKNAYDAIKRGVEVAKKKRTENRIDVEEAYRVYQELKNIRNTKKSIENLEKNIKIAVETNDISSLMEYAPKEKKAVSKELDMLRKKQRDNRQRAREILLAAEEEDMNVVLRWWTNISEAVRTIMLSGDIGWTIRNAAFYGNNIFYLKEAIKSYKTGAVSAFSRKKREQRVSELKKRPSFDDAKYYGMDMPESDSDVTKNELALPLRILDKFPSIIKDSWLGRGTKGYFDASSGSPGAAAIELRLALWEKFIKNNPNAPDEVKRAYANITNIFSGRGDLGSLESAVRSLNKYFFLTVRFFAAKLQTASIIYPYAKAFKTYKNTGDAAIVKEVSKIYAGHISAIFGILVLADLMGFDVEWDDDKDDFLTIKVGNSRYPVPSIAFSLWKKMYRMLQSSNNNRGKDALDEFLYTMKKSTNPAIQKPYELIYKKDIIGNKLTYSDIALSSITPLTADVGLDTLEIEEDPIKSLINTGLSFGGVSVQTYEKKSGRMKAERPQSQQRAERAERY